jgi:bacillithiol system protein YtxJ
MTETSLHDMDQYRAALAAHPRVLLFKHSPICPTSATSHREWCAFGAEFPDVPRLFVDVVAARAVARGLAEACGVSHQSPQAILFEDGVAVWHASHWSITTAALAEVWSADTPTT